MRKIGWLAGAALMAAAAPAQAESVVVTAAHILDVEAGRLPDDPVIIITGGRQAGAGTMQEQRP